MSSDFTRHSSLSSQSKAELELIDCLLSSDDPIAYPWNPADPAVRAYFDALEQEVADSWTGDDFAPYVHRLAAQFDEVWDAYPVADVQALFPADVRERLLANVPTQFLDGLIQKAKGAIAQSNTLADQLVLAVQELFPTLHGDDLQVLARPYAYAMRDGENSQALEQALQSVTIQDWEALSEMEQAKVSVAIARYIISQQSADSR